MVFDKFETIFSNTLKMVFDKFVSFQYGDNQCGDKKISKCDQYGDNKKAIARSVSSKLAHA